MRPAAEKLQARLQEITLAAPKIAVVNNVDVAVETRPEAIRDALVRQAWKPVRWTELVQWLVAQGAQTIAECGPGKVLAGMNKRIAAETTHLALTDAASLQEALAQLNG